jgi:hypothetical protein
MVHPRLRLGSVYGALPFHVVAHRRERCGVGIRAVQGAKPVFFQDQCYSSQSQEVNFLYREYLGNIVRLLVMTRRPSYSNFRDGVGMIMLWQVDGG